MWDDATVVAAWSLAVLVPGLAVSLAVAPRLLRRPLELLALAPVVGVGVTFAAAEVLALLHVPFGPWTTAAVSIAGLAVAWLRRRSRDDEPAAAGPRAHALLALALLFVGVVMGAGFWLVGIRGSAAVLPNRDGGHHGFYTARIADEQTVRVSDVVISDPITREAYGYYPLGLHATAAIGQRITGAPVAHVLTGWVILFATVVYPLGLFVLTRRLAPDRPLLPGFVALAAPFFGMFPYKWILWGGFTQLVGLAVVPVAVAALLAATAERRTDSAVLAGVAVFGIFAINESQALLAVIVAAILLAVAWATAWTWREVAQDLRALAVAAAVTGLLVLPSLSDFLSGVSQRQAYGEPNNFPAPAAIGGILTGSIFGPAQPWLYALALVGFACAMYQRRLLAWSIAAAAVLLVFFASAVPGLQSIRSLSMPWYRSPDRASGNTVPFFAVFAGFALETITVRAAGWNGARRGSRAPGRFLWLAGSAALVTALFIAAVFHEGRQAGADTVRRAYQETPTQPDDVRVIERLARIDHEHLNVLNQEQDGSIWIYADTGLQPLFTQAVAATGPYSRSTTDRIWLANHADELGTNPRVAQLVARYHLGYLYLNERTYGSQAPALRLDALRANPHYREIVTGKTSHVFRIVP